MVEIGDHRRKRFDRLGLADDVEIRATVRQQQLNMAHRLEPGTELRHRLANTLGDGADLAVMFGHQHDDAISLGKPVGAQDDGRVAIDGGTHSRALRSVGAVRRTR